MVFSVVPLYQVLQVDIKSLFIIFDPPTGVLRRITRVVFTSNCSHTSNVTETVFCFSTGLFFFATAFSFRSLCDVQYLYTKVEHALLKVV